MSITDKLLNENTMSNDELIDEIGGEIDNIDVLMGYICADFEKYIENANQYISAHSLRETQQLAFTVENQLISIARKLNIIDKRKQNV